MIKTEFFKHAKTGKPLQLYRQRPQAYLVACAGSCQCYIPLCPRCRDQKLVHRQRCVNSIPSMIYASTALHACVSVDLQANPLECRTGTTQHQ